YQTTASSPFTDTGAAGTASGTLGGAAVSTSTGADSSNAFRVQNNAGTMTVLDVDTTNQRLGVNAPAPSSLFQLNQSNLAPRTVSNTGAAVTGVGTTFFSTFQPGDTFTLTVTGGVCTISEITPDLNLTCTAAPSGSASGSTYSFTQQTRLAVLDNGKSIHSGTLIVTNPASGRTYSLRNDPATN